MNGTPPVPRSNLGIIRQPSYLRSTLGRTSWRRSRPKCEHVKTAPTATGSVTAKWCRFPPQPLARFLCGAHQSRCLARRAEQACKFYDCLPRLLASCGAQMSDVILERVFFRDIEADMETFQQGPRCGLRRQLECGRTPAGGQLHRATSLPSRTGVGVAGPGDRARTNRTA